MCFFSPKLGGLNCDSLKKHQASQFARTEHHVGIKHQGGEFTHARWCVHGGFRDGLALLRSRSSAFVRFVYQSQFTQSLQQQLYIHVTRNTHVIVTNEPRFMFPSSQMRHGQKHTLNNRYRSRFPSDGECSGFIGL